jgi:hypothetical protein
LRLRLKECKTPAGVRKFPGSKINTSKIGAEKESLPQIFLKDTAVTAVF